MNRRDVAQWKIKAFQFMNWYSILNAILIAKVFVTSFDEWFRGVQLLLLGLLTIGIWTEIYFRFFYSHELEINSRLNPEWNKLMEMQNNGEKRD